jgi:hypothetical protein
MGATGYSVKENRVVAQDHINKPVAMLQASGFSAMFVSTYSGVLSKVDS